MNALNEEKLQESYTYSLSEGLIYDEDEKAHPTYGIDAYDGCGRLLKSFPDVFSEKPRAVALINLCNTEQLDIIHLEDVIEDALL